MRLRPIGCLPTRDSCSESMLRKKQTFADSHQTRSAVKLNILPRASMNYAENLPKFFQTKHKHVFIILTEDKHAFLLLENATSQETKSHVNTISKWWIVTVVWYFFMFYYNP